MIGLLLLGGSANATAATAIEVEEAKGFEKFGTEVQTYVGRRCVAKTKDEFLYGHIYL